MPQAIKTSSFTLSHNGITNILITPTAVAPAFDPSSKETLSRFKTYNGIWDTGATNSVISQKVVDECGLKPIGIVNVSHAGGTSLCETYLVNIGLRNNVGISHIKVTKANLGPDTDVLIGMDIITRGDFAITNTNGKTIFTFRMPSVEHIDFTKQKPSTIHSTPLVSSPVPVVGRNNPCPCGSRKKYKNCHGK
jgi:hypothetical protein